MCLEKSEDKEIKSDQNYKRQLIESRRGATEQLIAKYGESITTLYNSSTLLVDTWQYAKCIPYPLCRVSTTDV